MVSLPSPLPLSHYISEPDAQRTNLLPSRTQDRRDGDARLTIHDLLPRGRPRRVCAGSGAACLLGQPIPGEDRLPPVATDTEAVPRKTSHPRLLTLTWSQREGCHVRPCGGGSSQPRLVDRHLLGLPDYPPGRVIFPAQTDLQGKRLLQNQQTGAWPSSPEQFFK